MGLVLVFAVTLLIAVLVSELAERSVLSTAVLFLISGFLVGRGFFGAPPVGHPRVVERFAELALFSVLFTDGMRLSLGDLKRNWLLPTRALVRGMPLTIAGIALAAKYIANISWPHAFLLGAATWVSTKAVSPWVSRLMEPTQLRVARVLKLSRKFRASRFSSTFDFFLRKYAGRGENFSKWDRASQALFCSTQIVRYGGVDDRDPHRRPIESAQGMLMKTPARFPYRFFIITFLWSWVIWFPLILAGFNVIPLEKSLSGLNFPALILAAFGPGVGALYSLRTLNGRGAISPYLRGFLDLRFGWKVWILPIVLLGGCTCTAWILPELFGASRIGIHLPPLFFMAIIFLFAGAQEELGWRGYILDPLEARLGPWLGNVVLGLIWAVWHLPLFLIPGSGLDRTPFPAFVLLTIGCSWFFAWARQASGKRASSGVYLHGVLNVSGTVFPTMTMAAGAPQARYWIWAGLLLLLGIIVTAIRRSAIRQNEKAKSLRQAASA